MSIKVQGQQATEMTKEKAKKPMRPAASIEAKRAKPEWASGLQQLYDSVLNEPLPDTFADLLSKLDENKK